MKRKPMATYHRRKDDIQPKLDMMLTGLFFAGVVLWSAIFYLILV